MTKKVATPKLLEEKRTDIYKVDVRAITPDFNWNPRIDYGDLDELAKSILANGVKKALKGRRNPENRDQFLLTDGHRRYKACMALLEGGHVKELRVPFELEERGTNEADRLVEAALSNNGGKPFSLLEYAMLIKRLQNFGLDDIEIGRRLAKSAVFVNNCFRLLEAPEDIKKMVEAGRIAPTLVINIFKKAANFNDAVSMIKDLDKKVKDDKKIYAKDVTKASGKQNSVMIFKKMVKANETRLRRENKEHLYQFIQRLINGEISQEEMESTFYLTEEPAHSESNNQ